jgi:hypothetical protein
VKPDNRRKLSFFECAMHCVSNHGLEFVPGVGFRDDSIPESMRRISALRGLSTANIISFGTVVDTTRVYHSLQ